MGRSGDVIAGFGFQIDENSEVTPKDIATGFDTFRKEDGISEDISWRKAFFLCLQNHNYITVEANWGKMKWQVSRDDLSNKDLFVDTDFREGSFEVVSHGNSNTTSDKFNPLAMPPGGDDKSVIPGLIGIRNEDKSGSSQLVSEINDCTKTRYAMPRPLDLDSKLKLSRDDNFKKSVGCIPLYFSFHSLLSKKLFNLSLADNL